MTEIDVLKFIVADGILNEYKLQNSCLNELVEIMSETPEVWKSRSDISVSSLLKASQLLPIYQARLNRMPDIPDTKRIKVATTKLVSYFATHSNANIWVTTFDCPENSYFVFCGDNNNNSSSNKKHLVTICIMVSNRAVR